MARRRQTRIQYGDTVATLLDGEGDSWWSLDPEVGCELERVKLDRLIRELEDEGRLGPSNPFPPMTIAEAARDRLGATIVEVEPPEPEGTYPPGTVF